MTEWGPPGEQARRALGELERAAAAGARSLSTDDYWRGVFVDVWRESRRCLGRPLLEDVPDRRRALRGSEAP
jgi:hypothetical protein